MSNSNITEPSLLSYLNTAISEVIRAYIHAKDNMLLCSYLLAICLTAEILSVGLKHNLKPVEFLPFRRRISIPALPLSLTNSFCFQIGNCDAQDVPELKHFAVVVLISLIIDNVSTCGVDKRTNDPKCVCTTLAFLKF